MELTNTKNGRETRRKKPVDLSAMVYGKVPPQAKDLEEAILGAILLEKNALDIAATIISPESFYVEAHQRVYRAALRLNANGQGIDIWTVSEELKTSDELDLVGGPYYVTKLTNNVVSSAHTETHCRIIQQKFIQREIIRVAGELLFEAYEDSTDAFELLNLAEENILRIGTSHIQGSMISMPTVVKQALDQIETWRAADSSINGVPSGFASLDKATRGWQTGLIIVAARPSVGKSAIALSFADAATKNGIRDVEVGVWSLEMKAVQNVLRMIASSSDVYLHRIQTGRLDDEQMKNIYQVAASLAQRKIHFNDHGGLTLASFRAQARRLKKKHPALGLIIIDYLQLMTGDDRGNREQEISKISRGLKLLSYELDLPIIALSQLSREVEKRTHSKGVPQLSDLRESGAIEQDADVVVFLWRPEQEDDHDDSNGTRIYCRIAKQRDGVLATVPLDFKTEIQKITEGEPVNIAKKAGLPDGKWKPVSSVNPNAFIEKSSSLFNENE